MIRLFAGLTLVSLLTLNASVLGVLAGVLFARWWDWVELAFYLGSAGTLLFSGLFLLTLLFGSSS